MKVGIKIKRNKKVGCYCYPIFFSAEGLSSMEEVEAAIQKIVAFSKDIEINQGSPLSNNSI